MIFKGPFPSEPFCDSMNESHFHDWGRRTRMRQTDNNRIFKFVKEPGKKVTRMR